MPQKNSSILFLLAVIAILILFSVTGNSVAETFDDQRTVDSYLPNYVVDVQRRCLPGEKDTERHCIKEGCPDGMERGEGSGSHLCYQKCLDGYDSNGMSRCYKRCPSGFQTQDTSCTNPGHAFKKDIVPCKACVSEPREAPSILSAHLEAPHAHLTGPVVMTPNSGYMVPTNLEPILDVEHHCGAQGRVWGHITEYFEGSDSSPAPLGPIPTELTTDNAFTSDNVTINLSEARIDDMESPCPRGYTLSGDVCYENCPPHYRDTNNGECVKDAYTIDRASYDRGSGVPYIVKRPKFEQIFHT